MDESDFVMIAELFLIFILFPIVLHWIITRRIKGKYDIELRCSNCFESNFYSINEGTQVKEVIKYISCKNCKNKTVIE